VLTYSLKSVPLWFEGRRLAQVTLNRVHRIQAFSNAINRTSCSSSAKPRIGGLPPGLDIGALQVFLKSVKRVAGGDGEHAGYAATPCE
jgi:hypothetical protein